MNNLNLSLIVILATLFLLILFAIVYTKFIKKDTEKDKIAKITSLASNSLKRKIKGISKNNSNVFYNLLISVTNKKRRKKNIFIPGIVISKDFIYILSSPLVSDKHLKYIEGKYFWKTFNLMYVNWFNNVVEYLSKEISIEKNLFKLQIPVSRKGKDIKNVISLKELNTQKFLINNEISKVIFKKIISLNIVNFKGGSRSE